MIDLTIIYYLLILMFSIITHEIAHGATALLFGDKTAREAGRITLNPFKHIDPLGTIILPSLLFFTHSPILFGWAKPVPVRFDVLRPFHLGVILVALAGPLTNLSWAFLALATFKTMPSLSRNLLIEYCFHINIILAAFNLLPFPPLDGGRILAGLLPSRLSRYIWRFEPYAPLFLMTLLILPFLLREIGISFNPLSYGLGALSLALKKLLFYLIL